MIYYKDIDTQLFEVKNSGGWFIAADSKEDALGLANKRGNYEESDIVKIGSCSTIFGKAAKYEDVMNMKDRLNSLCASLPKLDEVYEKAKHYTDIECNLQNFEDEDTILIERGRFADGYIKAIKDFVNSDFDPK